MPRIRHIEEIKSIGSENRYIFLKVSSLTVFLMAESIIFTLPYQLYTRDRQ